MTKGDGAALYSTSHPIEGFDPNQNRDAAKPTKYKIEIERLYDGPRPWEWRVFIGDIHHVAGIDADAGGALYEAIHYLDVDGWREHYVVEARK